MSAAEYVGYAALGVVAGRYARGMAVRAFWSYVHLDDQSEEGRISQLARDVISEFELVTGDAIELFLDRDDLEWGDNWRETIDESLATAAFFIPVLTPRYFASAECRRELQTTARRARELGIASLILPLLYADVSSLREPTPTDELAQIVQRLQWKDWTDVRLADRQSERYRREVADLVSRLVQANVEAEEVDIAAAASHAEQSRASEEDDLPGWLDRVAASEAALPEWGSTLIDIGEQIQTVGAIMSDATSAVARGDAQGRGLAARLATARRVGQQLEPPSDEILRLSARLAAQLHEVDDGIRAIIERLPAEVDANPSGLEAACEFFSNVRAFESTVVESFGSAQTLLDAFAPLEQMSRDLRRPLRKLREAITSMLEARTIAASWIRMIDETEIDCA